MNEPQHPPAAMMVGLAVASPITVNVGGYQPELVSLVLSLLTVLAVRVLFGFNDRGPGATRREVAKTFLAVVAVFAYDLTEKPGPGVAVIVGAGVGMSIVTLLDVAGERIVTFLRRMLGVEPPK